ncbi:MAG: hypothetical protein KDD64_16560 [Bdellovibrionales bacterium]|nr:hypothetical protein [Bdellovibrionales bacterium]
MAEQESSSSFGGCRQLEERYRAIGRALSSFESHNGRFSQISPKALKELRESLVFIPVEVLESYLDDLLNTEVPSHKLFLPVDHFGTKVAWLALAGLLFAVGVGLLAASSGAGLLVAFAVTLTAASPFAVLWNLSPREASARRMRFAHVLSHVISQRRGGKRNKPSQPVSSVFEGLWPRHERPDIPNAVSLKPFVH